MKRTLVAAVLALVALPISTASAKSYVPKKGHACRSGYVAKTIKKREHHKTVKVRECVSKPKVTPTLVAPTVVRPSIDPSFTQDPSNGLLVTFTYSASANGTLPDGTVTLGIFEHDQTAASYQCSSNVGGSTTSASCTVTLSAYGDWDLVVTYSGGGDVSSTEGTETVDVEPLPVPLPPAPVLSDVPANITTAATSKSGAVVTFTPPTSSVPVTCSIRSGSTVQTGTSTNTCTASNAGGTATASFTITVTAPTTIPTFQDVPSDMIVAPQSADGSFVTYAKPTATDVFGDPLTVECSPASGTTFAIGTTTVTCDATDQWGNHASVSFTVTVTPVTESLAFVGYDTSDSQSGATVPATITIASTDEGPGVGNLGGVILLAQDSGSLAGDLFPTGAITFTVTGGTPYSAHGVENGDGGGSTDCSAVDNTDVSFAGAWSTGCSLYFAPGDYTVNLSFASTDPGYGSVEDGPSVTVDVG